MLIDTHCHLDFKDFDSDRVSVIERSKMEGIGAIINVGSSLDGTRRSVELAKRHDFIYASLGIHPHEASKVKEEDFKLIRDFFESDKDNIVAVGEIGLDYYRNLSPKGAQKDLFSRFLNEAKRMSLPVIIHNREAQEDTLSMIKDVLGHSVKGVMHCFSGDRAFLEKCLDIGLFISFTCNITFKNASSLRDVVRFVPMDRLLLETDAPYLAPQVFRGKRNEPAYLKYLAEEVSNIKGLSLEEIVDTTTLNARKLFALPL